ncbi:MAG: hypothetical protein RL660_2533 [Bacteroidota bacterium]
MRRVLYLPYDLLTYQSRKAKGIPPKGLVYTGGGDFEAVGANVVKMLVEKHGLQPQHALLDIGSGIGRIAIPLTKVLSEGKYCGFDVVQTGVDWCTKNISNKHPHFVFSYVELNNDLYRNDGQSADQFRFPYEDESFDFAVANSLYTHMMPAEVQHYYTELFRVLKPGGKCYATFFTVPTTQPEQYTSNPAFKFSVQAENYRLMDGEVTAANIAFDETYLRTTIINPQQFDIVYTSYGYWRNESLKPQCEEFQDIVVVQRKGK